MNRKDYGNIPSYDGLRKIERLIRAFYEVNEQWVDALYYSDKPTDEVDEEIQKMKYNYIVAHWED